MWDVGGIWGLGGRGNTVCNADYNAVYNATIQYEEGVRERGEHSVSHYLYSTILVPGRRSWRFGSLKSDPTMRVGLRARECTRILNAQEFRLCSIAPNETQQCAILTACSRRLSTLQVSKLLISDLRTF